MSVVSEYLHGKDRVFLAAVKGAPEVLQTMFTNAPSNYTELFQEQARRGARVLALGYKILDQDPRKVYLGWFIKLIIEVTTTTG